MKDEVKSGYRARAKSRRVEQQRTGRACRRESEEDLMEGEAIEMQFERRAEYEFEVFEMR